MRRRLDEIFGDVLPSVTRDEMPEPGAGPRGSDEEEWLRANRPPHHDRSE